MISHNWDEPRELIGTLPYLILLHPVMIVVFVSLIRFHIQKTKFWFHPRILDDVFCSTM